MIVQADTLSVFGALGAAGSHGFCLLNNVAIGAAYAMNVHRCGPACTQAAEPILPCLACMSFAPSASWGSAGMPAPFLHIGTTWCHAVLRRPLFLFA